MSESTAGSAQHVSDETCVDLLLEHLPPPQSRVVLDHLSSCALCESRFRELAGQWEHAAVYAERRIPAATGLVASRLPNGRPLRDRFGRARWLVPVAAAATILVLLLIPRVSDEPALPPLVKLPALSESVQLRMALPPEISDALLGGIDAYNRGDFAGAIEGLERVDADGPLDAFRRIYLGSALAWSGRHGAAVAVLAEVPLDLVPEPWSSEGRWTMYVALLAAGETVRANALLSELQEIPGPVGDRARKIGG